MMNRMAAAAAMALMLASFSWADTPTTASVVTVEVPRAVEPACEDGLIKDDGEPETGYGWVPSVVEGIYVQELSVPELSSRLLEKVCICWMRTEPDDSIDFEVVIYDDVNGAPAMEPAIVVPASLDGVPTALDGAFAEVELADGGVMLGSGTFYVGARWNASVDRFFFVCADHSDTTPVVDGYFIDDRADEWTSVLDAQDPSFGTHRAMLIRAVAADSDGFGIPATGVAGAVMLATLTAGLALWMIRRRGV